MSNNETGPILIDTEAAKALYKDLRGRIEEAVTVASDETIMSIIDDYPYEGDEDMVFTANFTNPQSGDPYYETEVDAADIIAAFISGKYCVIHFPDDENAKRYSCYECAAAVSACTVPNGSYSSGEIYISRLWDDDNLSSYIQIKYATIAENGKLHIPIYVD